MRFKLVAKDEFKREMKVDFETMDEIYNFVDFYKLAKWYIIDNEE